MLHGPSSNDVFYYEISIFFLMWWAWDPLNSAPFFTNFMIHRNHLIYVVYYHAISHYFFLMWWETWIYREPSKQFRPSNSYYYCCWVKKTHDSKLYSGTRLDQSKPSNTHFLWPATSQFNTNQPSSIVGSNSKKRNHETLNP